MRVFGHVKFLVRDPGRDSVLPGEKCQVDVRKPTIQEPNIAIDISLLLGKMSLKDSSDAVDLLHVALPGLGDLLVDAEPHGLTIVRALACSLVVQPLAGVVRIGCPELEAQLEFLVVGLREVFDDGAGLPLSQICVRIVNGRETAIGVDGNVARVLDVCKWDRICFVGQAEFFKEEDDLAGVGAVNTVELDFAEIGHVRTFLIGYLIGFDI